MNILFEFRKMLKYLNFLAQSRIVFSIFKTKNRLNHYEKAKMNYKYKCFDASSSKTINDVNISLNTKLGIFLILIVTLENFKN